MTKQSEQFYELLNKMRKVHDAKRHDYASVEDVFKNFRTSFAKFNPSLICPFS